MVNPELKHKPTTTTFQIPLGEKVPEILYRFDPKTFVYPIGKHRGILRNAVMAKIHHKRGKYNVYESINRMDLKFEDRFWSLPEKTLFEASSRQRHQITFKK